MIIITNNPKVKERYSDLYQTIFVEGSYRDVLFQARDRIHIGHKLLTHPLSGSVKPNETPYKSVVLSAERGTMDVESLMIIEGSIATCEKFMKMKRFNRGADADDELKEDFREIDLTLIASALG